MIAIACQHDNRKKHGRNRNGSQRFCCCDCGRTWTEERTKPLGEMRTDLDKAVMALNLLIEGMSVRAVSRMTGLKVDTISNLILTVGDNCERFLREKVRDVEVSDVQIDELWSFVGMKEKTRKRLGRDEQFGDSYTFIAIERDSKLVLAHHVGNRDGEDTQQFLDKLRSAVAGRFQLSADGFHAYTYRVPFTFRKDVDFGRLIKVYQSSQEQTRYSPAQIVSAEKSEAFGNPDPDKICTSHVERMNLTLRMSMRRFTRLTNGFSKSLCNHIAMQNIFFAVYNFVRKHGTIKTTPAVAAGLTNHAWTMRELLENAAEF